jgi:hypothetical protein
VPDFITFSMCIYTCILRKTTTTKTTPFSLHLIKNKSNINEMPNATNDDEDLMDSDDDELLDEIIRDKVTEGMPLSKSYPVTPCSKTNALHFTLLRLNQAKKLE